jgi:hypothetical protein
VWPVVGLFFKHLGSIVSVAMAASVLAVGGAHAEPSRSDSAPRFVEVRGPAPTPEVFYGGRGATMAVNWSAVFFPEEQAQAGFVEQRETLAAGASLWRALDLANQKENGRRFDRNGRRLDCVGYVRAKREALTQAGLPAGALSPAVVRTQGGVIHAVLLVRTTDGDYVLDNLSPYVARWTDTDYTFIKREIAPGSASTAPRWAWTASPDQIDTTRIAAR